MKDNANQKIAILILAHKKPQQVLMFTSQFDENLYDIYIHFDRRCLLSESDISSFKRPNIYVLPASQRVEANWGHISLVQATLNLINESACNNYFFYILCGGQDLLIKKSEDLYNMLAASKNKNFNLPYSKHPLFEKRNQIPYFKGMFASKGFAYYYRNIWKFLTGGRKHTFPFLKSKFYKTHSFYYGSQWFAYNGNTMRYITNYLENHPDYLKFFQNKLVPDECFFQTIIHTNEQLSQTLLPGITYARFQPGASSPDILTIGDWEEITNSSMYIARKFSEDVDNQIIEELVSKTKPQTE